MKRKIRALSGRYLVALRNHLQQGPGTSLEPARELGRRAVTFGLETLDLARIHERALATMEAASRTDGLIERAEVFFTETITPIEQTHRTAVLASARLSRLNKLLGRRTVDLAASNRSLKQGVAQRKQVEAAIQHSREHYRTLLKESVALQRHLQYLTHRILCAQENKRKQLSHELQDEIAQTLLGITTRLLVVNQAVSHHEKGLQTEIACIQRLVHMSLAGIFRLAREIGQNHEA